jgi:hypothetical protein
MSFVKTLTTLAIGFAAAKGVEKVKKWGVWKACAKRCANPVRPEAWPIRWDRWLRNSAFPVAPKRCAT